MATAFDTLTVSRTLRDAGVDERVADAITHVIASARSRVELATKAQVDAVDAKLDSKIGLVEQRLIAKMSELNNRTLLATMTVGALIVAAIKLL